MEYLIEASKTSVYPNNDLFSIFNSPQRCHHPHLTCLCTFLCTCLCTFLRFISPIPIFGISTTIFFIPSSVLFYKEWLQGWWWLKQYIIKLKMLLMSVLIRNVKLLIRLIMWPGKKFLMERPDSRENLSTPKYFTKINNREVSLLPKISHIQESVR